MNPIMGRWRIESAEIWRGDELTTHGDARLEFTVEGAGSLRMGPIEAEIDYRVRRGRGGWAAVFSWRGTEDGHAACGRGWVRLVGQRRLAGKLFIHRGEDARFRALRL